MSEVDAYPIAPSPSSSSSAQALRSTVICGRGDFGKVCQPTSKDERSIKPPFEDGVSSGARAYEREDEFISMQKDLDGLSGGGVRIPAWVNGQVRRLLASRTAFSFYLLQSITQSGKGRTDFLATALFPIPWPFEGIWIQGLKKMNSSARHLLACRKLLHVAVMALNFLHERVPLSSLGLLQRHPGPIHKQVYGRLMVLIQASVLSKEATIARCGRKSFQFIARLQELFKVLENLKVDVRSKYHQGASGAAVPQENDVFEELRPYRSLDPSRLKISGRGQWDCTKFLDNLLYMPFVEPAFNEFDVMPPEELCPDVAKESYDSIRALADVWDQQRLLRLVPQSLCPEDLRLFARVFNNFKSQSADRQIGDRRGQNFREGQLKGGPSCRLPSGTTLLQLMPERFKEVIKGSVTDRKDFYHQFKVPWRRSMKNCTFPLLRLGDLKGLHGFDECMEAFGKRHRSDREGQGDFLGFKRPSILVDEESLVSASFGALFQGDHLGVEIACSAHENLLRAGGLLAEGHRLLADEPLGFDDFVEGLVIDDYFVVGKQIMKESCKPSVTAEKLSKAKEIYAQEEILGSDDKDVWDEFVFKAVGAEVDSRPEIVRKGAIVCGAPASKRLALASIASVSASLPYTSDALHSSLVGSLVSVLMFRRPLMSVLHHVFHVIPTGELQTLSPCLRPLKRAAAQELALISALLPITCSNLAAEMSTSVFSTDASLAGGGITRAEVPKETAKFLSRSPDKRGENLPILSAVQAVSKNYDFDFEELGVLRAEEAYEHSKVNRPIGLYFEFIEICGGAGVVTRELSALGVVCAPIFDLSFSPAYDLGSFRTIEWVIFMLEEGRLLSFLVSPPCTTFSPAAYPPLRSYKEPLGFCVEHPRVIHGNLLANGSMALLFAARRTNNLGMGEQPRRSKMRWIPSWKGMVNLGAEEVHLASCSFGSIHMKEFTFLCVNMDAEDLRRPCTRDHSHVKIEGKYTKPSATYVQGLAVALARTFKRNLDAKKAYEEKCGVMTAGLEDQLSTDLAYSYDWEVTHSWKWKRPAHINVLETASVLKLYRSVARGGGDERFVNLSDSHVSRSALARGRTSSYALRPLLQQGAALQVGYGLYPAGRFCPTRAIPADHPSRGAELPEPVPSSVMRNLSETQLIWFAGLPKMKRWISNWTRLVLLLNPEVIGCSEKRGPKRHAQFQARYQDWILDFDSSLGYPGEGPKGHNLSLGFLGFHSSLHCWGCWLSVCCCWSGCFAVVAGTGEGGSIPHVSHGDLSRQRARAGIVLGDGRRVTELTASVRQDLSKGFRAWLGLRGLSYDEVFLTNPPDLDYVNKVLCDFGRHLFQSGKPYYHFSETINAVACSRPILRRALQQSWDLAAMWGSHEPTEHHVAMPYQVLLSILSVCLVWGWNREAACFALAWGALLRIGEIFQATRKDLVIPEDVAGSIDFILIRIAEPKTRFRAARHQSGKLEQPDLIEVVTLGFGSLRKDEKLWPFSGSTLRLRLVKILKSLGLPSKPGECPKPLGLSSFRPGGATWLITQCESGELVRRRGRWANFKVMEIYLQEVSSTTYLADLDENTKAKVNSGMHVFVEALALAKKFQKAAFPNSCWPFFFAHGGP